MRDQGSGGRIINFTSQGWQSGGFGGSVAYAATKGGIVSMTRGLARSLAPHNITVNAVSPGAADTAMMRSGMDEEGLAAVAALGVDAIDPHHTTGSDGRRAGVGTVATASGSAGRVSPPASSSSKPASRIIAWSARALAPPVVR